MSLESNLAKTPWGLYKQLPDNIVYKYKSELEPVKYGSSHNTILSNKRKPSDKSLKSSGLYKAKVDERIKKEILHKRPSPIYKPYLKKIHEPETSESEYGVTTQHIIYDGHDIYFASQRGQIVIYEKKDDKPFLLGIRKTGHDIVMNEEQLKEFVYSSVTNLIKLNAKKGINCEYITKDNEGPDLEIQVLPDSNYDNSNLEYLENVA